MIHLSEAKKTRPKGLVFFAWLGWPDLNRRMPESKSGALPLGDIPINSPRYYIIFFLVCQGIFSFSNKHVFAFQKHQKNTDRQKIQNLSLKGFEGVIGGTFTKVPPNASSHPRIYS